MIVVLTMYFVQIAILLWALRPRQWRLVPGGRGGITRFDTLLKKYIFPEADSVYLDQLIVDYAGMYVSERNETLLGAIQIAQKNNQEKQRGLMIAGVLFSSIVCGLIVMAILAVN